MPATLPNLRHITARMNPDELLLQHINAQFNIIWAHIPECLCGEWITDKQIWFTSNCVQIVKHFIDKRAVAYDTIAKK